MLRAFLKKSIATVATVGSVAAVAAISAPAASAADGCYPGSTATTTTVTLTRTIGQYGEHNAARVSVTHDKDAPVNGASVVITLTSAGKKVWTKTITGGSASLPTGLAANATYKVSARYAAQGCYKGSTDSTYYIVKKAKTSVGAVRVHHAQVGSHPRVTGVVVSRYGRTPHGHVTVTLSRNGRVVKTKTVSLDGGRFGATFGKLPAGRWVAGARYAGRGYFTASRHSTSFRVAR